MMVSFEAWVKSCVSPSPHPLRCSKVFNLMKFVAKTGPSDCSGQFDRLMCNFTPEVETAWQSRETTGKDHAILQSLSTLPESCVLCFDLISVLAGVLFQAL